MNQGGSHMNLNTKFIDIYRRLEYLLLSLGYGGVKGYEDSLNEDRAKQGQLRICRTVRNYIEHESAVFVFASDKMIAFLESELSALDEGETPVKKKMIGINNAIHDDDLVVTAAAFMNKRKTEVIPVFDKNNFAVGLLTTQNIMQCLANGSYTKSRKVGAIKSTCKFSFITDSQPMKQVRPLLDGKTVFLVLNSDKKVIGWIN